MHKHPCNYCGKEFSCDCGMPDDDDERFCCNACEAKNDAQMAAECEDA